MNREMFTGKNILLYPDNLLSRSILQIRHLLRFKIIGVVGRQGNIKTDRDEKDLVTLKDISGKTDCLMIMEHSPLTMLLPPYSDEARVYHSLIKHISQRKIQIVSPLFSQSLNNLTVIQKVSLETVCAPDAEDSLMVLLPSTRPNENLCLAKITLLDMIANRCISYTFHYENPVFGLAEFTKDYACIENAACRQTIAFLDAPAYTAFTKRDADLFCYDDWCEWKTVGIYNLDCAILLVQENDSFEMIMQTMTGLRNAGIETLCIAGWFQELWKIVYLECKLGKPVVGLDTEEGAYKLVCAMINRFGEDITRQDIVATAVGR